MSFHGKVTLVTGATRGIGEAIALMLADRGAHVLVSGRDRQRGERVVTDIRGAGGSADFLGADLADAQSCKALAAEAVSATGSVDILINNAAIGVFGSTATIAESDFDNCYAINVKAPFYLVGALAPAMAARGEGVIVNVSTMVASFGTAGSAVYASSKAALNHLTKCWAAEYGPQGVRVNAVAPGPTLTDNAIAQFSQDGLVSMMRRAPARRAADPGEIASAAVFLASEEASFIHGAILPADGGRTAS
jgi:NAD(P)-dependent dehydrogenase (short-subunit alcohol dehydrogenase family)